MKHLIFSLPLLCLAAVLAGCGKCCSTASGDAPARSTPAKAEVEWPALKDFDVLGEKAEGACEKKDTATARASLSALAAAAQALVTSPIPSNVHNPLLVKELVADVRELANALGKASTLADDALLTLVCSVHPLVEKLMEESGLPHSHGNDPK